MTSTIKVEPITVAILRERIRNLPDDTKIIIELPGDLVQANEFEEDEVSGVRTLCIRYNYKRSSS